ncbi:MAG: 2-amino-4-hydroxy-6-hydroxymethyldihydropteridine diphosphokinase [Pseudomonadota bacterium]
MIAFISLGSNRPYWRQGEGLSPVSIVRLAAGYIDQLPHTQLWASSGLYESAAIGPGRQRPYINAVAAVDTQLHAHELLAALNTTEDMLGRTRSRPWQARTLDLDLLDYNATVTPTQWRLDGQGKAPQTLALSAPASAKQRTLMLPHPRLHMRDFVLRPLAELCPNWVHPVYDVTVAKLLKRVPSSPLRRLGPLTL